MDFLTNFNLAGMEFHYALGLVGLFLGMILLITAINYGLVEPIRKRRLINQRLRGISGNRRFGPRFSRPSRKPRRAWS